MDISEGMEISVSLVREFLGVHCIMYDISPNCKGSFIFLWGRGAGGIWTSVI